MPETIELLAPARDFNTGKAAIDCGADAVYIGAEKFGAREAAGNSLRDIDRLCQYAHQYWAKVYVTFNTLLYDHEFPQVLQLINGVHLAGADGVIIQDFGLLECELPPIPLIASTQMHNNTPEKVAFLEQVGFQRVILARELSLSQIQQIRTRTTIELEFFIHGALCVSYSGQCYLSYALGGRSGNRGQCAQPCRHRYHLEDAHGRTLANSGHLLSLRDLNLSDHLADLIETGIRSFKIEGRLKDQAYVRNIVGYYRQKLDSLLPQYGYRKSSSGQVRLSFTPDPNKTFNRGYTSYFLKNRAAELAAPATPKHLGEPVGKISQLGQDFFSLDAPTMLAPGDGICYFNQDMILVGTQVNRTEGKRIFPDKCPGLKVGTVVYRNRHHEFLKKLLKNESVRKIDVALKLQGTDQGFILWAQDEDQNTASFELEFPKRSADKPEAALINIERQLTRMGGTNFQCNTVQIDLETPYFLPLSILNQLRRGVLRELTRLRLANRPVANTCYRANTCPYPASRLDYSGNVLNQKARIFYQRHGVNQIELAAESGRSMNGARVMTTRFCLKNQLGHCENRYSDEPWFLVDEEGRRFELRFRCDACEMEIYYHTLKNPKK